MRRRERDRTTPLTLALRDLAGNLTVTSSKVIGWYVLAPQRWSFRADSLRNGLIQDNGRRLTELTGRRVYIRVTSRPYPVDVWARNLDSNTPKPVAGEPGHDWAGYLTRTQRRLALSTLSNKEVFVGVDLGERSTLQAGIEFITRQNPWDGDALTKSLSRVTAVMAKPGFNARPATTTELEWLIHRSIAPGIPAPAALSVHAGPWDPEDLYTFTDQVRHITTRFGQTVQIVARREKTTITRFAAALTLGRMDKVDIPGSQEPWMQLADQLPFAEWTSRFDMLTGDDAKSGTERVRLSVRDQQGHYREHGMDVPLALERRVKQAARIEDDMAEGTVLEAARAHGWHRIVVTGSTEDECLDRVEQVKDLFHDNHIDIEHPVPGQDRLVRELIPGEPLASTAHKRRMPVLMQAAALPQVTSAVGDDQGCYAGYTCGTSRRAVFFDTHYAPEVKEASNMVVAVGEPGSGKALALDTPLPTPTGWVDMGDVEVGDYLIGDDGRPTRVVAKTDIMNNRHCYRVSFSDGTSIVADANHEWVTRTRKDYMTAYRKGLNAAQSVRTTEQIAATMTVGNGERQNHAIRLGAPLMLPPVDLPIDPYVLGCHLGDGNTGANGFTCFDPEILVEIEARGYGVIPRPAVGHYGLTMPTRTPPSDCSTPGCKNPPRAGWTGVCDPCRRKQGPRENPRARPSWGVKGALRSLGLMESKFIPSVYLRASKMQRRDLLAGLLDTDGYASKSGGVVFAVTSRKLAYDTLELARSLGYKPTIRTKHVRGRREESSTCYSVAFTSSDKVFHLTRKLSRQVVTERDTNNWRYITGCDPVPSVPVRCVEVDNDSHMYLAGEAMIPTHNSHLIGSICHDSAMRGIVTTILDPSGPLATLCETPHLRNHSRHIDLLEAPAGTLNPYAVITEPLRGKYESDTKYQEAVAGARRERRELAIDIIRMLLPPAMVKQQHTETLLIAAARRNGDSWLGTNLWGVVQQLEEAGKTDEHAASIAAYLNDISDLPQTRLFFGSERTIPKDADDTLLVITMAGLIFPNAKTPRESWTTSERVAVPLRHLAGYFANRRLYRLPRTERKTLAMDELGQMEDWTSGKTLITRTAMDSRKNNACFIVGGQNPGHILGIHGIVNFLSAAFVGRIEDEELAAEALKLLRVKPGIGYEPVINGLSPDVSIGRRGAREFLFGDVSGAVEKIRVDTGHNPELEAALFTTPGQREKELVTA